MKVEFSPQLHRYLKRKGYTHLYSLGNRIAEGGPDHEDYILLPLLPGDPRIEYEETDAIVSPIEFDDVKDMAEGDQFINFYIELPLETVTEFKQLK